MMRTENSVIGKLSQIPKSPQKRGKVKTQKLLRTKPRRMAMMAEAPGFCVGLSEKVAAITLIPLAKNAEVKRVNVDLAIAKTFSSPPDIEKGNGSAKEHHKEPAGQTNCQG